MVVRLRLFLFCLISVQFQFFSFSKSSIATALPHTEQTQAFLHAWQRPADCSAVRWVESHCQNSGIGSEIHVATAALAYAINNAAIMIWSPTAWLRLAEPPCATFDCVFLPISNCTRESLLPENRIPISLTLIGDQIPKVFANVSAEPFTLKYWWRAQGTNYLTRFRPSFRRQLDEMRARYFPDNVQMPCNSVCVFVRHGAKSTEMTMLPFRSFLSPIKSAFEMLHTMVPLTLRLHGCARSGHTEARHVFLMTDDPAVITEAPSVLDGIHLLHINDLLPSILPHEKDLVEHLKLVGASTAAQSPVFTSDARGSKLSLWTRFWMEVSRWRRSGSSGTSAPQSTIESTTGAPPRPTTAQEEEPPTTSPTATPVPSVTPAGINRYGIDVSRNMTHNFYISFLQLQLCLECDAFVGQRQTNFFRLIDELRMTRAHKLWAPIIEAGVYSFDWK
jgi:hypothetical protein